MANFSFAHPDWELCHLSKKLGKSHVPIIISESWSCTMCKHLQVSEMGMPGNVTTQNGHMEEQSIKNAKIYWYMVSLNNTLSCMKINNKIRMIHSGNLEGNTRQ